MSEPNKQYKYCFVPECKNTSVTCPKKIFITVPKKEKERVKWLKASRRDLDVSPVSLKSYLTCCEDHFDLENDVEDWYRFKFYIDAGLSTRVKLKPGVVAHKFECQKGRNLTASSMRKSVVAKLGQRQTINQLLLLDEPSTNATAVENAVEPDFVNNKEPSLSTLTSPEAVYSKYCDKIIQVRLRAPYRSKTTQTGLNKEAQVSVEDRWTQVTPENVCS